MLFMLDIDEAPIRPSMCAKKLWLSTNSTMIVQDRGKLRYWMWKCTTVIFHWRLITFNGPHYNSHRTYVASWALCYASYEIVSLTVRTILHCLQPQVKRRSMAHWSRSCLVDRSTQRSKPCDANCLLYSIVIWHDFDNQDSTKSMMKHTFNG